MLLKFLFQEEPDITDKAPGTQHQSHLETEDTQAAPSSSLQQLQPSTHLTHPAMFRALDVQEITYLIRQELKGYDLKSMLLVNHLWWKSFAPYLWENIYIDADPEQDDQHVLFRNGLAARCLTLSIYDPLDSKGVVKYVAEKCRNVTELNLRLFSPELVQVDKAAMQGRITRDQGPTEQAFALQEETTTTLLDSLLSQLKDLQDLTLFIAHESTLPEIVWCAIKVQRLRKLTVLGGLSTKTYVIRKNWNCNWTLLTYVARECPWLEHLSIAWESRNLNAISLGQNGLTMMARDMCRTLEETREPHALPVWPEIVQVPTLRQLSVSFCEVYQSLLKDAFKSFPNLREVEFKSLKITKWELENHVNLLTKSCPRLRSFQFVSPTYSDDFTEALLNGPLLKVPSLKLLLACNKETLNPTLGQGWVAGHSISVLDLDGVNNYWLLFKIISTMTGLSHLTLAGLLRGVHNASYEAVLQYSDYNKSESLRLPGFASKDTLCYLDVTRLDLCSLKCHGVLFDRIQELPQLRKLEISYTQVRGARLEETWANVFALETDTAVDNDFSVFPTFDSGDDVDETDETVEETDEADENWDKPSEYPDVVLTPETIQIRRRYNYETFGLDYAHGRVYERGPESQEPSWRNSAWLEDQLQDATTEQRERVLEAMERKLSAIPDKVFRYFPAVEYLYVLDDEPCALYWQMEHYLSEHMVSAMVQMMPRLKIMAFDLALGTGLRKVQKTYRHVNFNCIIQK